MLSSFFSTSSYFSAAPPRVRQLATLPNRACSVTRLREWYGWPENVSAVSCIMRIVATARSEEGNRNYRNKVNQTVGRMRTTFNINAMYDGYADIDDDYYTYQPTSLHGTLPPSQFHRLHYHHSYFDTHCAIRSPHYRSFLRAADRHPDGIRAPPPVGF